MSPSLFPCLTIAGLDPSGGAGIIALEGEARRAAAVLNGTGTIDLQGLRTDLAPDCSVSGVGKILQKAK